MTRLIAFRSVGIDTPEAVTIGT